MQTTFYKIKNNNEPYDILFHEPTSRFARIDKRRSEIPSEEKLRQMYPGLDEEEQKDNYLVTGKGRIGLTFMSSRTCNLKCRYCFAGEGEYGCVETKPKYYTLEGYQKAVKTAMVMYPEGIKSISFFGGEPLLNWNVIKEFVPWCVKTFEDRNQPAPAMAISTNMVLMNREIAEFMKKYDIKAVISLDGPKKINDYARISSDSKLSVYDKVVQKCGLLDEAGVQYAVQATINKQLLKDYRQGDGIKFVEALDKINWENMAIVPVETDIPDLEISDADLPALDAFTREVTNCFIDRVYEGKESKIASGIIAPILQLAKNKHVRTCTSGHSVFCDTDGSIYPCQMFCNEEEYKLGDIDNGWSKKRSEKLSNITREDDESCKNCISRNICFMWCKGIQLLSKGDMYKVCEPRCVFQRANTEECIKLLAKLNIGKIDSDRFWNNFKSVGQKLREDGFINE